MTPCRPSQTKSFQPKKGCCADGCSVVYPGFRIKGTNLKFCSAHKNPSCVTAYNSCSYPNCNNFRARFINQGKLFCHIHKPNEAVEVKKKCRIPMCENRKEYNYPGFNPLYCHDHSTNEMVLCHEQKHCDYVGCGFIYGYKGLGYKRCDTHKLPGMIPRRQCEQEGCHAHANWHHISQPSTKCSDHREPGMILKTTCIVQGCYRRRYYNYSGQPPMYCSDHATDEMLNVTKSTEQSSKPKVVRPESQNCLVPGCTKNKRYGYVTLPKTRCSEHKKPGMIRKTTICRIPLCRQVISSNGYCHIHCGDKKQIHRFPCIKCQKLYHVADINVNLVCYNCDPFPIEIEKSESVAEYLYAQRPDIKVLSAIEKSLAVAERYMTKAFSHRIEKTNPNTYVLKSESSKSTADDITIVICCSENAIQEVLTGNSRLVNVYGLQAKQIAKKLCTIGN